MAAAVVAVLAGATPAAAHVPSAWVQMGPGGKSIARLVVPRVEVVNGDAIRFRRTASNARTRTATREFA